jgi:osmotically-inducible protein OsmY
MQIPDRMITQQVGQKLARAGIRSPCRVDVQTRNGEVTLLGSVQYLQQKGSAVQTASGVTGVRRVIDQMIVKPLVKR